MPEHYLIYRRRFDELGLTADWRRLFSGNHLTDSELQIAKRLIWTNEFRITDNEISPRIAELVNHYTIYAKDLPADDEYIRTKAEFDALVMMDPFVDLTLTYDYENTITV